MPRQEIGELLEPTPVEGMVELTAETLYEAEMDEVRALDPCFAPTPWRELHEEHRRRWRKFARKVVAAIGAPATKLLDDAMVEAALAVTAKLGEPAQGQHYDIARAAVKAYLEALGGDEQQHG